MGGKKKKIQKEKPLALSWGRCTPSECAAGRGRSQRVLMLLSLAMGGGHGGQGSDRLEGQILEG